MTAATEPRIDIMRLLKVRRAGNKIVAQCPVCHAAGGDKRGAHLFINSINGKFGCIAFRGDKEHLREIFALVGIRGHTLPDYKRDQRLWMENGKERRRELERKSLLESAQSKRDRIIANHQWRPCDVFDDSPQRIDHALVASDPRHFIASLFPQQAMVWTGEVHQSGQDGRHADRWRPVSEWQTAAELSVGPMVCPATWLPGTISRSAANVAASPYIVLDFDGFEGIKPQTPREIIRHVQDALSLVHWLHRRLRWNLAAIVWTGSKSIHAWFNSPSIAAVQSLADTATAFGIDTGLVGRPEHPCRLPGQIHEKTGKRSRVLWLQNRS